MSPIRYCSSKGKSIAITSGLADSESSGSLLVGRPRAITLGGMEGLRFPTGADLAELNDQRTKNWENPLPTRSSFNSVRRLVFQTELTPGFTFLIPDEHQRPWTPPSRYVCVYESWFNNCRLWWPLLELLTTYCSRRKIALGQYTANEIRIMVALMVLAAELDIKMSFRLFEELTTPSITAKTGFFYGKMVSKYSVLTGKPSKVNHWNQLYLYVKLNDASFEDPSVILNGYFNANINRHEKWAQAIKTLSHQHWPDISEIRIQAALNRIVRESKKRRKKMGKFNLASLPSYAASIGTPPTGQEGSFSGRSLPRGRKLLTQTWEKNWGSSPPAPQDDEVVEYPHLVNFHYHHIEIPFVGDHKALARLFHQIKLKLKGLPELDELSQFGRDREMARAGANFFGYVNLMVRDYEVTIKAQKEKLAEKSKFLKKKKKENVELKGKWDMYEEKKSRGDLLSKELEEIKAQKEMLESRLRELEQEKVDADSKFETTTKRLRESREHEVRKERLHVEAAMKQQVMSVYKKMHQYLDEQSPIQSKLVLYSQAKGAREGLEKIQALGMSIDEVLE
ncbi:hypothetical protein N665_0334s0026 [Sinapis alba]|nr:hypothetical protein N665_0334s0026 [Sinapis alba]